jgi:1,4-dihydroxy-2-naphthoate octaprenyltransferase
MPRFGIHYFFLAIYAIAGVVFAVSMVYQGFSWIALLGLLISAAMGYRKIQQIRQLPRS